MGSDIMNWLVRRTQRRYLEGLRAGYRDCARLLMAHGYITVQEFAVILRACETAVSKETAPPKRKVLKR